MAYTSGGRFSQQYFRPLDSKPFVGLGFGRETVNGQWTSPQLYIYSFPLSLYLYYSSLTNERMQSPRTYFSLKVFCESDLKN